jgi:PAS domain-containing protein
MDAIPILRRGGRDLVGVALLALLRRERARVRTEARERARRDDEFRRELAAAEDARRSADLVLSSMEDGVLLFGPDGGTRLANPAVEAQLGVRPASVEALLPLGLRQPPRRTGRHEPGGARRRGRDRLAARAAPRLRRPAPRTARSCW